jgi:predicted transcriptional regulator
VIDYAESKVAWLAAGLPVEGDKPVGERAGSLAAPVATGRPHERVGDLRDRLGASGLVVVVDDTEVVLGVVHGAHVGEDIDATAASRMRRAPVTVRPSIMAGELASSMARDDRDLVLVTTFDGHLLGLIRREDLPAQGAA